MKRFLKYLVFAAIFLVAYYTITHLVGDFSISVKFGKDDALAISGPAKSSVTVSYEDIEHIELTELTDPGTKVDGGSNRTCYWGTWSNDRYGECTVFTHKKATQAILIRTRSGETILFNQLDNDTTVNTYRMFSELLEHLEG